MHTARLLTVSQHALCRGVGGLPWGCLAGGGVCPGECLPEGVSQHALRQTPPYGQTDTCENNLRKLRLRVVIISAADTIKTSKSVAFQSIKWSISGKMFASFFTQAPQQDFFSVHIRTVGDWTTALSKLCTDEDGLKESSELPRYFWNFFPNRFVN